MGMNLLFTADTHFGHSSIIEYADRPWATADEMDEGLIEAWNSVVGERDDVWHLGDFFLGRDRDEAGEILRRLNGRIHVVYGNHDERSLAKWGPEFVREGLLASTHPGIFDLKFNKQHIVLCHYAMAVWDRAHHGAWMLHGHSHGNMAPDPDLRRMDVGVDGAPYGYWPLASADPEGRGRYRPISYTEVAEHMARKTFQPVDHHGRGR